LFKEREQNKGKLVESLKNVWDGKYRKNNERAKAACDYISGIQWSDDVKDTRYERGEVCLVFNEVKNVLLKAKALTNKVKLGIKTTGESSQEVSDLIERFVLAIDILSSLKEEDS
jgi:hypothetical protein